MRADNYEPIWDRAGEVPTGWAVEQSKPTPASKAMGFFYKKLQYQGTVDQAKRNRAQPQPKTLNILAREPERIERYLPPDPQAEEGAHPTKEG